MVAGRCRKCYFAFSMHRKKYDLICGRGGGREEGALKGQLLFTTTALINYASTKGNYVLKLISLLISMSRYENQIEFLIAAIESIIASVSQRVNTKEEVI
jgi:hypothetical protein